MRSGQGTFLPSHMKLHKLTHKCRRSVLTSRKPCKPWPSVSSTMDSSSFKAPLNKEGRDTGFSQKMKIKIHFSSIPFHFWFSAHPSLLFLRLPLPSFTKLSMTTPLFYFSDHPSLLFQSCPLDHPSLLFFRRLYFNYPSLLKFTLTSCEYRTCLPVWPHRGLPWLVK